MNKSYIREHVSLFAVILFLFIFGLEYNKLSGILDNSINKINKKMYGTNFIIESFNNIIAFTLNPRLICSTLFPLHAVLPGMADVRERDRQVDRNAA